MEGQTTEIEPRATDLLAKAQHLIVGNDETRLAAGGLLKMIKGLQKEVKADREPVYRLGSNWQCRVNGCDLSSYLF